MISPSRRLGWLLMALLALHALVPDVGRAQITPGSGVRLQQGGSDLGRATTLDCESGMSCSITGSVGTLTASGGGGGAPTTAKYITQTPDATLSAEQALSALTTGLLFNTTTTGVLSIYSGDACTNQFPRSVSASGVWVCAAVAIADLAATGTPSATTFLRGDNTWATPAGGGNVTAGTLTSGTVPKASGATAIADSLLTDNGTTLGYTGTGGVSTPQMTLTGAAPGLIDTLEGAAPSVSASGHARIYADSTTHTFLCSNNGGAYAACGSGGGGSGTVTTSGSPASGNLTKFSGATAITNGDLAGDVTTSGTLTTVLANIPTATPAAGTILHTAIAAPGTPAPGKGSVYVDSTSKNLAVKDDAGTVKHGVQTQATVTSSFVTAISDAGAVTVAQPADVDLTFTDVTTNNVSTTKHGFTPKLPNDSSKYLDGTGAYSVPAGGGGGGAGNNNALFTSTADGANNALASDTSIIGTGVGSKTTAANYFVAGTSLMMVVRGTISTAATPATLAIKVKAGSVVVCQMTAQTLTALLSSATWELNVLITNRMAGASGTFKCNGIFASTGSALTPLEASIADTGNAVDTTGTIGWDLTAIWGATTAGDTITGTNFVMFTPGTGLADPGGNGILVRTALNTTSAGNLSGDVTSSNLVTTLANIPTATPAVGTILHTNIAAPSSPAAGKVSIYTDSTDLRLHDKNASGVIGTTVVADTGASNNFLTAISAAGAVSKAQPAFTNLSGSVAASQMPALTGDVTTSAGAVATTIASTAVTYAKMQNVSAASKLLGRGDSGSGSPQEITLGSGLTMTGTTLAASGTSPTTVLALTSDATTNSTTTGVEITGLNQTTSTGTYTFQYFIRHQSGATSTGVKFGVNHTGTATVFMAQMRYQGLTGAPTASTQASASGTPVAISGAAARAFSTTAPNMGPTISVDTANADMMTIIEGLVVVTVAGDLELWHASEVAAASTVMTGSSLILTKTN